MYLLIFIEILLFTGNIFGEDDGQYHPYIPSSSTTSTTTTIRPINYYRPVITRKPYYFRTIGTVKPNVDDGKYHPSDDGKYIPTDDGKYTHIGDQDLGKYSGGGGEYIDDIEKYKHIDEKYKHIEEKYIDKEPKTIPKAPPIEIRSQFEGKSFGIPLNEIPWLGSSKSGTGTGQGGSGWKIIQYEKTLDDNSYHYLYETENGILAEESGSIETVTIPEESSNLAAKGFYEYTGDDGKLYRVDYTAGDEGFVPEGEHIPKIPPLILKMLKYLESEGQL